MNSLSLTPRQDKYLKDRRLEKKFIKQLNFLLENPFHPSLNLELLEPKEKGLYSFRLDRQYRVIFIFTKGDIEVITITNHYR
ncbi:MAG: type II toxin-antitoxin system RelE/ParE family toxin [Patescibacteria group bacterium]